MDYRICLSLKEAAQKATNDGTVNVCDGFGDQGCVLTTLNAKTVADLMPLLRQAHTISRREHNRTVHFIMTPSPKDAVTGLLEILHLC
jgi:hypothetical protein